MQRSPNGLKYLAATVLSYCMMMVGCAHPPVFKTLEIEGLQPPFETGTIVHAASGRAVSFEEMIADMATTRVVFVGERHTDAAHHAIQLRVIKALQPHWPGLQVGMEMFDHTYQPKLDRWSRGAYDYATFLKETHWYANWRHTDSLYADILNHIRSQQILLVGLNVPFHLPPKISLGGIASLSAWERQQLPDRIDTTHSAHRAYLKEIFDMHPVKGGRDFEDFYTAQCVWEDGMAQGIAQGLSRGPMVVLVGNGHIQYKYGVPLRMYDRTQAAFRTLYLAYPRKEPQSAELADYIWVTPRPTNGFHQRPRS